MKKISKFILPIICAVSAILLAFVNSITAPKIKEYEEALTKKALQYVAGSYTIKDEVIVDDNNMVSYYYALEDSGKKVGYILGLKSSGYGGELTLVASYDLDGKIMNAKLLADSETPGVGKKAENDGYMDMFIGKDSIPLKKDSLDSEYVSLVSGATLTFGGISRALNEGSIFVKGL